jgi:hypothetical protein
MRRVLAVIAFFGTVTTLVTSTIVLTRYWDGFGPEMWVAVGIGGLLVGCAATSVVLHYRSFSAAHRIAATIPVEAPDSALVIVSIDRRSAASLQSTRDPSLPSITPGWVIVLLHPDSLTFWDGRSGALLGSLRVNGEIRSHKVEPVNFGEIVDQPALCVEVSGEDPVRVRLFDASTGKKPSPDRIAEYPRSSSHS